MLEEHHVKLILVLAAPHKVDRQKFFGLANLAVSSLAIPASLEEKLTPC